MGLRSRLVAARQKVLCSLYRRTALLGNLGPIVSFGFDDFPRSAYLVAGRILETYGGRGTYYVAPGLMGTSEDLGELCHLEDLHSVLEKGHELGTQTFQHSSCRTVSLNVFQEDVQKGIRELQQLTGVETLHFAYPYGHLSLATKRRLGPVLRSSRSIFPGINGSELDLNLLLANRIYGDLGNSRQIEDLILRNAQQKGWLIFYTHDVRPNPSEYGCTPEIFEFAVSTAVKSGNRILTIDRLLAEIGGSLPTAAAPFPTVETEALPK